ncbi:CPCC family cysteine-rich protein [Kitasatospora sp. NPDC091335]|uniref:CPCC family cysteine-rich protein n=1 Tax=Kitasatospora sp. NPDC091335 TaxID=3364085 RepID=UPI00380DE73A
MDTRRPCPCCGHLVFDVRDGWPGSFVVCPVCHWEDDPSQLRWPLRPDGANSVPLVEAQRNVREYGACDQRGRRFVRPATPDEPLDPAWRPVDLAVDVFEDWRDAVRRPWPEDRSVLCWWLPAFWDNTEDEGLPPVPDPLTIDVGSVRDESGLHAVLKRELRFPAFYGMNWAAFRDSITGLVPMPGELRFVHWAELEHHAPHAAAALREQLARFATPDRDFTVRYDSDDR